MRLVQLPGTIESTVTLTSERRMIPGGSLSEHLEVNILGSHMDGSIIALCNDPGITAIIPHAFQACLSAVHLIVYIAVSYIEAVDPLFGQDFHLIP